MLSSKANAALTRLKEIEEKYKMKRKQQNWNREEDSSISSVSIDLSEKHSAKESVKDGSKLKLDVKIPDMRFDNEKATSNMTSSRSLDGKVNPDLVTSVKNTLQEDQDKKQESVNSDITTIQENSFINSVLSIGSTMSSSRSRSKTLRQDVGNNKASEGGTKAVNKPTKVEERERIPDRSEIAERRTSSITKRSRMSKRSNDVSKLPSDLKDRPFKVEAVAKRPETANLDQNSGHSNRDTESLNDNSIIEESIDTIADDSEIISEFSRVDESVKIEDSTNASEDSGQPEDVSVTLMESTKRVVAENATYANDTFEDVSSSTARSKSKFQNEKVTEINDGSNDDKVAGLTIPKSDATERDLESASDLERTGGELDNITAHLIKSNPTESSLERIQKEYSQRRSQLEEDIPSVTSHKNVSNEVTQTHANMIAQRKSSSRMTRISEIDQQENSSKIARKTSENSSESKAELKLPEDTTTTTRNVRTAKSEDERHRSSVKDQEFECNSSTKKSKTRAKVGSLKSVKARGSTGSREEAKALNLDGKQLRKRIVELRLRQEREDLQKYLRELKDLRLESSTRSYFSPLEFPKIAEFTFDTTDSESKLDDRAVFRERVSAIRRWLKDQYILYRDYCTMAQAINAHYVPTSLEDAERMIHGSWKSDPVKTSG